MILHLSKKNKKRGRIYTPNLSLTKFRNTPRGSGYNIHYVVVVVELSTGLKLIRYSRLTLDFKQD